MTKRSRYPRPGVAPEKRRTAPPTKVNTASTLGTTCPVSAPNALPHPAKRFIRSRTSSATSPASASASGTR